MDPRDPKQISEDSKLADEFAKPGSVKHFLLRQGFMPFDEKEAEAMLIGIIEENEKLIAENERLKRGNV